MTHVQVALRSLLSADTYADLFLPVIMRNHTELSHLLLLVLMSLLHEPLLLLIALLPAYWKH
jgi:hypothetical protein